MKVLVACEHTGVVRDAFAALGHDAMAQQWEYLSKVCGLCYDLENCAILESSQHKQWSSKMAKIKTSELTDAALDWAVAIAEGVRPDRLYSRKWEAGGPIIEREKISPVPKPDDTWSAYMPHDTHLLPCGQLGTEVFSWNYKQDGATFLEAAMRCYVASRLGDEVEVPTGLV
jgi:hypothetical protein